MPPELFNASAKPSPATDIYALGKVLYMMITGYEPGRFPSLPSDLDRETLRRLCRPLARLCDPRPRKRVVDCAAARSLLEQGSPRPHLRGVLGFLAVLVFLLVSCAALLITRHGRRDILQETANAKLAENVTQRLSEWNERLDSLQLQLDTMGGSGLELTSRMAKARELLADDQNEAAIDALDRMEAELARFAIDHSPPPVAPDANFATRFRQNALAFGFLASPLGKLYLPKQEREALQERAETEAKALESSSPRITLRNGQELFSSPMPAYRMKYVPPGVFCSPITGRGEVIDYPYWVMETEVPYLLLEQNLPVPRAASGESAQPATRVAWDEMLSLCNVLTRNLRREIDLPPGYAVRLPTEAEWELAALGGSCGRPPVPEEVVKGTEAVPAQAGEPNLLGLLQIDRNLSEVIGDPYPGLPPAKAAYTVIRGSNFQSRQTGVTFRAAMRHDQVTLDYIGFRPVLAPTPENYLETHWFRSNPLRKAEFRGHFYTGLESCGAAFLWDRAAKWATALGARLPEPEDAEELTALFEALQADTRYNAFLGIAFDNGAWRRRSDGSPANLATGLAPPAEDSALIRLSGQPNHPCYPITPETRGPNLILEWPSRDAYEKRPQFPCDKVFTVGGRSFGGLPVALPG